MKIKFCLIFCVQFWIIVNGNGSDELKPVCDESSESAEHTCGRNEVFADCGAPCPETCEFIDVVCPGRCKPGGGCVCEKGYVRNEDNVCVPAERYCRQKHNCKRNEVFTGCGALCERQCNIMFKCREGCEPKCVCRDGYIRNADLKCIRESQCPPPPTVGPAVNCSGEHKYYSECGMPPECTPTCDNPEVDGDFCGTVCAKGCFCEAGYVLNQYGDCVLPKECPGSNSDKCSRKPNEVYMSCGKHKSCIPTCENPKPEKKCPEICKKGCFCKEGFLRNKDGICVPANECPIISACAGENEQFYACGSPLNCTPTCDDRKINVTCVGDCTKGCYCKDGYLRNGNGVCVLEADCPSIQCFGDNEIYNQCGTLESCEPTCDDRKTNVLCENVCVRGCYCKTGYIRDRFGNCILEQNCPSSNTTCEGDHKIYTSCGKPPGCQLSCENPQNDRVCAANCVEGCVCESGYLINANGDCVKEENCPPKCGANQEYQECGSLPSCLPTCENPSDEPRPCPYICVSGCYCKPGYLMNANGECIKSENCPPSNECDDDPLKMYNGCGKPAACRPTCENPINTNICPAVCVPGCFCKPGYLMNKAGKCIEDSKCPPDGGPPKCSDRRKYYNNCGKPDSCRPTCENPVNKKPCPAVCVPGCYCKEGYLMNQNGKCIRCSKCPVGGNPVECDDPLKEYNPCGKPAGCTATCENPVNNKMCVNECNPGCFCKEGYLINKYGKCIKANKCPVKNDPTKCIGRYKVYNKCGFDDVCLPTCENPHNTRPCPKSCTEGCFCDDGYLINANGVCVPEDKCPPQNKCVGDHKYYDSCGKPPGYYPTCENPFNKNKCPDGCVESCYCETGYLMNAQGDCIRASKCKKN